MQDKQKNQADTQKQNTSIDQTDFHTDTSLNIAQKKSKLIFRKKRINIPLLLNYSYIFKISQSLIINERAIKQPLKCTESFMTNIFYFKSIQSLTVNQNYIILSLKEKQHNQFPICYYTQRFRSFGDKDFYELAQTLDLLDLQYKKQITTQQINNTQEKLRQVQRQQLTQMLNDKKGKKLLCFSSQKNGNHITMNKIIISKQLLLDLGYDITEICKDFIRFRHVFFQIFDTSFYYQMIKRANQILQNMKNNANNSKPDVKQGNISTIKEEKYNNYIFRVRQDKQGSFQQKVRAQIIFSKPHHYLSVYEVSHIDQSTIIEKHPQKFIKNNAEIKEWEQNILSQQIKTLEGLSYQNLEKIVTF